MVQIHVLDNNNQPVNDFHAGTPYVPVNVVIDGYPPFRNILAMFDTGADGCSIAKRLTEKFMECDHVEQQTAAGPSRTRYFKGTFEIVGLTQPLRMNIKELTHRFDAIIGRNIMAGYCITLDSRAHVYKIE